MPLQPHPLTLPDVEFEAFQMLSFGVLPAPTIPSRFGFQLDIKAESSIKEVIFGLVQPRVGREAQQRVGFAVRVDLENGEIWDVVNESGLIGWIEQPLTRSVAERSQTMLMSLEIERVGSALLPKLQIGGEEWLYPAIRCPAASEFTAIAGITQEADASHLSCFTNPTVWSEDLRAFA